MAEDISKNIVLDVEGWLDSPQAVIDELRASASGQIVIDASAAGPVSAQVAQLLLAARQSVLAHSGSFEVHQPSEAVQRSVEMLGLSDVLLGDAS
ncbi:MAG: STAS domain-containing protein [Pseudomonadota bacterium]